MSAVHLKPTDIQIVTETTQPLAAQPQRAQTKREGTRRERPEREPTRTVTRRYVEAPPPPKKQCNPAFWLICLSCTVAIGALVGCGIWFTIGYNDGNQPPHAPPPPSPPAGRL